LRSAFTAQSLSYLLTDPTGIWELRLQLYQAGWSSEVARLTDAEVVDEVRDWLRAGILWIDEEMVEVKKTSGGAAAPEEAAAPTVVPPPPRQPKKEEEPDPDTLPPNLDAATQAATLQAAAAQGAPFCPT
jgi:hypothetical protein